MAASTQIAMVAIVLCGIGAIAGVMIKQSGASSGSTELTKEAAFEVIKQGCSGSGECNNACSLLDTGCPNGDCLENDVTPMCPGVTLLQYVSGSKSIDDIINDCFTCTCDYGDPFLTYDGIQREAMTVLEMVNNFWKSDADSQLMSTCCGTRRNLRERSFKESSETLSFDRSLQSKQVKEKPGNKKIGRWGNGGSAGVKEGSVGDVDGVVELCTGNQIQDCFHEGNNRVQIPPSVGQVGDYGFNGAKDCWPCRQGGNPVTKEVCCQRNKGGMCIAN